MRWLTRARPGSEVREVRASALLEVPAAEVWAVLIDFEGYPASMPATAAATVLAREGPVAWVYLRYEPPLIAPRDTLVRMVVESGSEAGGTLSWTIAVDRPDLAPRHPGVVRLTDNEGSWRVEPRAGGAKALVTYQLFSSPGGEVPAFFVNQVTGLGIPRTFEALRRAALARLEPGGGILVDPGGSHGRGPSGGAP